MISSHRIIDAWNIILSLYCLKDYSLTNFSKINIILGICTLICAFLLVRLGYVKEVIYGKAFDAFYEARDLGFHNPNSLGKFIFLLLCNLYVVTRNKIYITTLLIILISFFTFKYCGSRTYLLSGLLMVVFSLLVNWHKKPFLKKTIITSVLISLALFFYYIKANDPILNLLLSGRLGLYNSILSHLTTENLIFGYTLGEGETLDNAYISMLCIGGIVYFIFFIYIFIRALYKNYNYQYKYLPVTLSILASGFMESGFVALGPANVLLLWLILLKKQKWD